MDKKILIFHPAQQHSYRLAESLYSSFKDTYFLTSVYFKKSLPYYLIRIISLFFPNIFLNFSKRKIANFPDENVYIVNSLLGFLEIFLYKFSFFRKIYLFTKRLNSYLYRYRFSKIIIKHNINIIIGYDDRSFYVFDYIKKKHPNILLILDVSSPSLLFQLDLFKNDYSSKKIKDYFISDKKDMKNNINEIKLANKYILTSNLTIESISLINPKLRTNQILKVNYGSNFTNKLTKSDLYFHKTKKPILKFIYVGRISYAKGSFHLLEAFSDLGPNFELYLAGQITNKFFLYKYSKYKNIHFLGHLNKNKLDNYYNLCDVVIFPTLVEGQSLTIIESIQRLKPIIASKSTGLDEDLVNMKNCIILESVNKNEIQRKVTFIYHNQKYLYTFSKALLLTMNKYTWSNYASKIVGYFKSDEIFNT